MSQTSLPAAAKAFLSAVQARRSIYQLTKKQLLPEADLVSYIKELAKQSPTAFNGQTPRLAILLGEAHERYWTRTLPEIVNSKLPTDAATGVTGRFPSFAAGSGTVIFFEHGPTIEAQQSRSPSMASMFPQWSEHGSAIAQINVWTGLEAAGYGASLQHIAAFVGAEVPQDIAPKEWGVPKAELVFGAPDEANQLKEKSFLPDEERFKVVGGL